MKPALLASFVLAGFALAAAPPTKPAPKLLPLTKLTPAKPHFDQCVLRYRITTSSPECQAYFDQALGYFYSYVWKEAARSFETAIQRDPNCPMAWWGLSRALSQYGRGDATKALLEAWKLKDHCSAREQMLIKASMQDKGQLPNVGDAEARRQKAIATIDELLALYEDDEEAWYFRAQLAGGNGLFGGKASSAPFYKALLKINPLHPGANHELLHFYENVQRPALGWVHAEKYIESSPGLPHAFHMQAHLATRLGRWQKTSDRSAKAIALQREYHKREGVAPREDSQYSHHLETLLVSLTHDGRFAEAAAIKKECEACGFKLRNPFFRLLLAERDYDGALKMAAEIGRGGTGGPYGRRGKLPLFGNRGEKTLASYQAALVYLKMGEPARALPEIEVLRHAIRDQKSDRNLESNLWETQGLYLCLTGEADAGCKLLQKVVDKTKNNYGHHAWGNGAVYMEQWGFGALQGGKLDIAEEAFHEALAHDPGSVRAALGMQVLCERQNRAEEAERYAALARRCWAKADAGYLAAELAAMRGEKVTRPDPTRAAQR